MKKKNMVLVYLAAAGMVLSGCGGEEKQDAGSSPVQETVSGYGDEKQAQEMPGPAPVQESSVAFGESYATFAGCTFRVPELAGGPEYEYGERKQECHYACGAGLGYAGINITVTDLDQFGDGYSKADYKSFVNTSYGDFDMEQEPRETAGGYMQSGKAIFIDRTDILYEFKVEVTADDKDTCSGILYGMMQSLDVSGFSWENSTEEAVEITEPCVLQGYYGMEFEIPSTFYRLSIDEEDVLYSDTSVTIAIGLDSENMGRKIANKENYPLYADVDADSFAFDEPYESYGVTWHTARCCFVLPLNEVSVDGSPLYDMVPLTVSVYSDKGGGANMEELLEQIVDSMDVENTDVSSDNVYRYIDGDTSMEDEKYAVLESH